MAQRPVVFDKARFHLDSVRSHGLDDRQAYVHGGMFFGWAVDRGLVLPWVEDADPDAFAAYRRREITGPALFASVDGAVIDDQFTDEGLAFVATYFDLRTGAFLGDWTQTMAAGLPSEFHVADTWDNAAKFAAMVDARHAAWRATWDTAQGRLDLRRDAAETPELPASLVLPAVPITSGVVLPQGPLGIRAVRPASQRAVDRALAGDRRLWLVTVRRPGKVPDPGPGDLVETGVVAEIVTVTPAVDRPGARDLVLQCVARAELVGWIDAAELVARVAVLPEPEPTEDEQLVVDEVRLLAVDVARRRAERGEAPGNLALSATLHGAALLDAIARDLQASRQELLTVLEAPELGIRAEVVRSMLEREP
ncbi:MAG: LON peptidase substrate-binding domain-containing protein [Myxococcota bacterium]